MLLFGFTVEQYNYPPFSKVFEMVHFTIFSPLLDHYCGKGYEMILIINI